MPGDTAAVLRERVLAMEHRVYPMSLKLLASDKAKQSGKNVIFQQVELPAIDGLINPKS